MLSGCTSTKPNSATNVPSNSSNNTASTSDNKETIHSGLLLGLVAEPNLENKSKNNTDFENKVVEKYRTLWIYGNGSNISYSEKNGGIITPYGDNFLKLTNNSIIDSNTENLNNFGDSFYSKYSSYYNFSVILSQAVNDNKTLLTKDSLTKKYINSQEGDLGSSYISRTETILYVGNKYAAIKTSQYATGGGTYKSSFDDIKLYDIKSLANLEIKRTNANLKNLLGNDVDNNIKILSSKYNTATVSNALIKEKKMIDDTNLSLKRTEGKWIVQAPLYEVYNHEGNGSNFNTIQNLYDTNITVPQSLTSYDTLCIDWNTIKSKIPDAKDAVSSPNKDMLVVLTSTDLKIFVHPEKGLDKPVKTLPVDKNEKIVLNQWATGDYVTKWTKSLSSY